MYNERFTFEDNLSPLERQKVLTGRFNDLSGAAKTQGKAGVNPFGNAVDVGFQVRHPQRSTAQIVWAGPSRAPCRRVPCPSTFFTPRLTPSNQHKPPPSPPSIQDPENKFTPGDLGFDPLGFSDNGIRPDYALAEIKHARLAMLGALGMLFQVRFEARMDV